MDITYQYSRKRSELGRQPLLCERGPELCDSLAPHQPHQKDYMLRNPVHQATQHTPRYSQHTLNTYRAEYSNSGANHAEGGWPKDVNLQDPEATQRYRRKVEKDDGYIHCVMSQADGIEHYVRQNNAIDMYQTYYGELPELAPVERGGWRTVSVLRDGSGGFGRGRPVSSLCWQPETGRRLAVTHLLIDMDRRPLPNTDIRAHIWDIEYSNEPEMIVRPPCALLDLQYSPRDLQVLAGGLINGQVAWWDTRSGPTMSGCCPPHEAHRDFVRSVLFINSKSGVEFFSGGPDGCCKWWDMRNMNEPTDLMIMDVVKSSFDVENMATSNGISALEYEPTIPTRFMVGTENGLVLGGNRKGKTPMEKLPLKYDAHIGPVWSLERNPSFLKNFLTVGPWVTRVWSEDCRESAVLWSPPLRHKLTAGTWSPTRVSLMLVTQWDGRLGVWDFLRRQHTPVISAQVCPEPLMRVRAHNAGSIVGCGSREGNVYLIELSSSLSQSDKNDKSLLTAVLERESKRERILEARMREIRLKMRQAEEGSPAASATDIDPSIGDRDLATAAAEFNALIKKELATPVIRPALG